MVDSLRFNYIIILWMLKFVLWVLYILIILTPCRQCFKAFHFLKFICNIYSLRQFKKKEQVDIQHCCMSWILKRSVCDSVSPLQWYLWLRQQPMNYCCLWDLCVRWWLEDHGRCWCIDTVSSGNQVPGSVANSSWNSFVSVVT